MEAYMRTEFTGYHLIPLGLAIGIGAMWMGMFPMIVIIVSNRQLPPFFFFGLFAFGALLAAGAAAGIPWLHRQFESDPDIIIDDTGLVLRRVKLEGDWWAQSGELMPWSEIQSVELGPYGRGQGIYVLWRGQRFRYFIKGVYVDGDGKSFWYMNSILEDIKVTWDRCRNGGPVTEP
jgi:hypothetical protein